MQARGCFCASLLCSLCVSAELCLFIMPDFIRSPSSLHPRPVGLWPFCSPALSAPTAPIGLIRLIGPIVLPSLETLLSLESLLPLFSFKNHIFCFTNLHISIIFTTFAAIIPLIVTIHTRYIHDRYTIHIR